MRKHLVLIIAAVFMWAGTYAQAHIDAVHKALDGNNAQNIVRYFDNTLSVTINDGQTTYSKAQAENVVKSFLTKNTARLFTVVNAGASASREDQFFVIGEIKSNSHGKYKVFLLFKQKGNVSAIQQLKFDLVRD